MIGGNGRHYSRDQLVQAAHQQGFPASERLVTDWIEHGLLDRPVKRGLGRGKGSSAGWSAEQYQLWLALLQHRQRGTKIADLCNVPVGLWLYFGDCYVPLWQVRRALGTWAGRYGGARKWEESRSAARRLLDRLPASRFRNRLRKPLVERIANVLYNGFAGVGEAQQLRHELLGAVRDDPPGSDADGVPALPSPDAYVDVIIARLEVVRQLPEVPDRLYHWARVFLLHGLYSYQQDYPQLVAKAKQPEMLEPLTWQNVFPRACIDLLTVLGMGLIAPNEQPADHPVFSPAWWDTPGARSSVTTQPLLSRLLLPNGEHPIIGLEFNVTATVDGVGLT